MSQEPVTFVECFGKCGHRREQDPTRKPIPGYWCPECKPKFQKYLGDDPVFEPDREKWSFDQKAAMLEPLFVGKLRKGFSILASSGDRENFRKVQRHVLG